MVLRLLVCLRITSVESLHFIQIRVASHDVILGPLRLHQCNSARRLFDTVVSLLLLRREGRNRERSLKRVALKGLIDHTPHMNSVTPSVH